MYCRRCGEKNVDQAKYCAKCGNSLVINQPQAINNQKVNIDTNKVVNSNLAVDSNNSIESNNVVGTKKNKKVIVLVTALSILCLVAVGITTYKVLTSKFENSKTAASKDVNSKDKEPNSAEDASKSTIVPEGTVAQEIEKDSNSISSNNDKQVTEEAKLSNLDQKEFSMIGTINSNLNLHMKLNFSNNEVSGTYYYDSYDTERLNLKGVYDKDNNIAMNELDINGKITGLFNGVISDSGKFIGTWTSPDGTKKFPFVINPSN